MAILKYLSFVYLLTSCFHQVYSQSFGLDSPHYPKPDHPSWFKAIPVIDNTTPQWVIRMYLDDSNFRMIEELKNKYYRDHPFIKNIHTQNYKYWFKKVKDYVNDDGYVNMPDAGAEFLTFERTKSASQSNRSAVVTWKNIGPSITYKNNGSLETRPTQANVYCIGVSPSNPSIVYAGMETGGIFKSEDKGLNWFPVSFDYAIGNIQDIKVDPLDHDVAYAARAKELYKTIDGGDSWNLQYTSSGDFEQFYIHSTTTDTIYAATRNGLLKSADGGATWTTKFAGRIYDIEAKPGSNSIFYIAVENPTLIRPEIWKSTDYGNTWTLMDNGYYVPSDIAASQIYGCKIGVTPADPNRVYAGIIANGKAGDNGWIGVYYSLDEGATWQEDSGYDGGPYAMNNDPATNWYVAGYSSGYHQGWYNFDLDVSHSDPDKIWIGTIWFCESGNRGGNIEYIRGTRSLEMHADIQDIDVVGNDIWVTSDGGINYSNDECQTVEVRTNGITASDFWGWGQGWNEDTWVGGRYHNGNAAFHENYGTGNTMFLGGAEAPTGYVNPFNNRKMYMSDVTDKMIPSSLSDKSTNISNLGLYPTQSYYHFNFSEVEWDPRYANHVYIGKDTSLYKSTNGGSSFDTLYKFPGEIRRFEISRDDPNYIYAIIYHDYWTWKIHRSIDGGNTFTELATPTLSGGSWRNLSFSLNPFDKDEIWLASNSSSDGNKIFYSIDGGSTWVNKYTSSLSGRKIKDLLYHASPQGDLVYALTDNNFFYHEKATGTWIQYNSGLPVQHKGFLISPFYRDQKIRLPSAKGIWEGPLVNTNKVQAMPMVSTDKVYCSRDTVYFESFSILDQVGSTFTWSFPGASYVNDLSARNPKVVFGSDGDYDVSLTITQSDGQMDTQTISKMVNVSSDCNPEVLPGLALKLNGGSSDYASTEVFNGQFNTFTMMGWIKRDGNQPNWAGIFFTRGSQSIGLNIRENNELGYHPYYWWGSGHILPDNEWTHIALVFDNSETAIYMNGNKASRSSNDTPLIFDAPMYIGADPNFSGRRFIGEIDEVSFWNRALTQEEIRKHRHLTKNDVDFNGIIHYYQFNENVPTINDKIGIQHVSISGVASKVQSSGPFGGGESEIFSVTGTSSITSNTGIDLEFPGSGLYPNGEIVLSKINNQPNFTPDGSPNSQRYWIINNYGSNVSFSALSSISFSDIGNITPASIATDLKLYQRPQNDHNNTWSLLESGNNLDFDNGKISFSSGATVNSFGQFTISNSGATGWIGPLNSDWDNPQNWGEGIIPDINTHVIIPPLTPFQPIVNINAVIKSLTLMEGAELKVETGKTFEIKN